MDKEKLPWGAVKIIKGRYSGHIGYYDDDDIDGKGNDIAVVYLGDPLLARHYYIPLSYLSQITTDDLFKRREDIFKKTGLWGMKVNEQKKVELITEYAFVESLLAERLFVARFRESKPGKKIFISHSSRDKQFARLLTVDLANIGHSPWLDEWKIKAGESIPKKIGESIKNCDFVIVILTENSVKSRWVENEWHAKYWDEIKSGKVKVIPALFKKCRIPSLLKTKKYANFTESYNNGLEELLDTINT
ncbi:MAG: transmembrane sensor domain-containing protein [Nitrospirae bacterium]|nr:MAG: transmembrane sensor domain-containing protein [Nitrospirota bacterium]